MLNIDPNMNLSGNLSNKTVKLVFGCWTYRTEITVVVGGNGSGLDNIKPAIDVAFEHLQPRRTLYLKGPEGELECRDDEGEYEEWLADMLVSAEVVDVKDGGTIANPLKCPCPQNSDTVGIRSDG